MRNMELASKEQKNNVIVDTGDVKWYLSRKGKRRGYTERQELEHSGPEGGPINLQSSGSLTIYEYGTETDSGA
jgi:hypothetical protein